MAKEKTPYWELPSFVQYSKKMCTAITVFWMIYRITNFVVLFIRPDVSNALVNLVAGIDTVMICNMGFYMGKSGFENVAKIVAARKYIDPSEEDQDEDKQIEENVEG